MSKVETLLNPRDITQAKTFTKWCNLHLSKTSEPMTISDIGSDLINGIGLIKLSEHFVNKGGPIKYTKEPKNQLQRVQNCNQAIERFESDNLQLINIHASTLADEEKNNIKVFMGLIFQLILRYSVGNIDDELDADAKKKQQSLAQLKQSLIDWVNAKLATLSEDEVAKVRSFNNDTTEGELKITNLEGDWTSGTALTGLAIALHPQDKRDNGLNKLKERVAELGATEAPELFAVIERAEKNLTVPALMDANDMKTAPDVNSMLTYLSGYKSARYVDDEPVVEKCAIEWDEPKFLQTEVECLETRNLDKLNDEKLIIEEKLNEYNQNKADGKIYEASCDRKAQRMQLHLRRIVAAVKNAEDDKNAANGKADENAAALAQKDADKDAALAKQEEENQATLAKKEEENQAALAQKDEEIAKKQQELDETKKALDDEQAKGKKLQDDLDASQKALEKLQRRQTKLGELQAALLTCATISDEMMNDEESQ